MIRPKICVPKRITEESKPVISNAVQAAIAAVAAANLALAAANTTATSSVDISHQTNDEKVDETTIDDSVPMDSN